MVVFEIVTYYKIQDKVGLYFVTSSHCLGMNYYVNFWGGIGSNGFHINEYSATWAIEKIKILRAVLELPAKQ